MIYQTKLLLFYLIFIIFIIIFSIYLLSKKKQIDHYITYKNYKYSDKLSKRDIINLKKGQQKMLQMFKIFDKICRENDIYYWCYAGTLLGVIRHNGWIPHDGDIDICMLDKDYDKFNKIAQKFLPKNLWLQNNNDTHYKIKDGLIKIRDLNSCYLEFPYSELHGHNGLQIDIFKVINRNNTLIVDKVPNDNCKFDDIFPLKEDYFENLKVYIPNKSKNILKKKFSKNYMNLPTIDKRYPHEGLIDPNTTCSNHKILYPKLYS